MSLPNCDSEAHSRLFGSSSLDLNGESKSKKCLNGRKNAQSSVEGLSLPENHENHNETFLTQSMSIVCSPLECETAATDFMPERAGHRPTSLGGGPTGPRGLESTFSQFCRSTSLHGWRFLTPRSTLNRPLRITWIFVVLASLGVAAFFLSNSILEFQSSTVQTTQDTSRASLLNVYFPSVTLCNINQFRGSLIREVALDHNETMLDAVLKQVYFGSSEDLLNSSHTGPALRTIFTTEDVVRSGLMADTMREIAYRGEAVQEAQRVAKGNDSDWRSTAREPYVSEAGWYFKTLAVQEIGENVVLRASYRRVSKNTRMFTALLPFFGTDYGICTLIKPQITFNPDLEHIPFDELMMNYTKSIEPGIQLGKENGLSILLDAEVYDYGFSPQRGEGFKIAIHHHMDQPIMALSDVDISPGFVTQLSVTPTLIVTTQVALSRFTPDQRRCYVDSEFRFKYLPQELYRYGLSNCLFAATYDQILDECRCVPFFHTLAFQDFPKICAGVSLLCMNKILRDIGSHTEAKDDQGVRRPCFPPCRDQRNKVSVTTSVFPNRNTFLAGPEFCLLFQKLNSTCATHKRVTLEDRYPHMCDALKRHNFSGPEQLCSSKNDYSADTADDLFFMQDRHRHTATLSRDAELVDLMYRYARENLALVNVYIKDPAVTRVKRDQKVPTIWFIANIGGILGLSMGCSLVTIFEILHHAVIVAFRTGVKSIRNKTCQGRTRTKSASEKSNSVQQQQQQ